MLAYGKNTLKEIDLKKIRKIYLQNNFKDYSILKILKENHLHYTLVPKNTLDKMTKGNHQGIILEIEDYEYFTLNDIQNENFLVALDHLEDVHNFGAIIRTCEAAGVSSIIIPKDRSVHINDTVIKTSSGAIERVKIIMVSNLCEALKKLKKQGYFIYSAFMDGDDYQNIDYADKKVLVIGNEGKGISKVVKDITDVNIGIPMSGKINSLNASVAAGILIFKMNR